MTITVITQTTEERNEETKKLFEQIRPLLDNGYGYMGAVVEIGKVPDKYRNSYYGQAWFRDLKEYGEQQGYPYDDYRGKGLK